MDTKNSCTRRSDVSSGWKDVASRFPCRTATILPVAGPPATRARTSTPGSTSSTQGARMKTPVSSPSMPSNAIGSSKDSVCRPKALRRTVIGRPPKVCCPAAASTIRSAIMIIPAQVPNAGMPSATRLRTGSNNSAVGAGLHIAVDSPPGITRASTCSSSCGRRTKTVWAPSAFRAAACSRKSPCSASTPIVASWAWLPATVRVALVGRQRVEVDPDHGLAEVARDLGDQVGVVEVGGGLDDGLRPLLDSLEPFAVRKTSAGLEDAGAHEHALGTELHHHRGVGRGGYAAGGEQHDRQLAGGRDLLDQLVRGLVVLGGQEQLGLVQGGQLLDVAAQLPHVPGGLHVVAGAGLALGADHRRALGDAAQGLAEVGGAADEGDGERPLVDVVGLVGGGEDPGPVAGVHPARRRPP